MFDWDTDIHDKIVQRIYEAASDPDSWNETINDIGNHLDFGVIQLMLVSRETGFEYLAAAPRQDPNIESVYLKDYAIGDSGRARIGSRPVAVPFDEQVVVPGEKMRAGAARRQEQILEHRVYNIMGSNMSIGDCQGWFGVTTRKPSEDFTDEQRNAFQRLLPHVLLSMRITKTNIDLQIARGLASKAFDQVRAGVFLFLNRQLASVNRVGRSMLKEGCFIVQPTGLACRQPGADKQLQSYLQNPDNGLDVPLLLRDSSLKAQYCVRKHDSAISLSADSRVHGRASRLVSVTKLRGLSAPNLGDVENFGGAYGLSEAEIHVLLAVLRHEDLKRLAKTRGVNLDTVRKQLKSAMARIEVRSQKELFRMYERFRLMSA